MKGQLLKCDSCGIELEALPIYTAGVTLIGLYEPGDTSALRPLYWTTIAGSEQCSNGNCRGRLVEVENVH